MAVVCAGWGGLALGVFGLVYQLVMRATKSAFEPSPTERAAFGDARIIVCLVLVPQATLLTLPAIYRSPHDVPKVLGPAAIFVAAMLLCVWVWLLIKIAKAGRYRAWYSFPNLLIFSLQAVVTLLAVAVYLALHVL